MCEGVATGESSVRCAASVVLLRLYCRKRACLLYTSGLAELPALSEAYMLGQASREGRALVQARRQPTFRATFLKPMHAPSLERPGEAPQQQGWCLRGEGSGRPVQRPADSMAQQPCSDGLQRGPHCEPAADTGDPHGGQYLQMQQRLARQLSRAFGSGRLSGGAAAALRELCPSARFFRCARRRLSGVRCSVKPAARA